MIAMSRAAVRSIPPDQVPRRARFEAAHPQVQIVYLGPAWQAVIPRDGGEDVLTRFELRDLLDELERRLPEPPERLGLPDGSLAGVLQPGGDSVDRQQQQPLQ
jgi:hypothetical protein